jgi:hypothetical protein
VINTFFSRTVKVISVFRFLPPDIKKLFFALDAKKKEKGNGVILIKAVYIVGCFIPGPGLLFAIYLFLKLAMYT